MSKYIAAIDQGTTSTRCMLFDRGGQVVSVSQQEHRQIFPRTWLGRARPSGDLAANTESDPGRHGTRPAHRPSDIAAVGITNQRETTLVWNKHTGEPYYNAIVWQDTRTKTICDELAADGGQDRFRAEVGLPLATYFSGPKIKWILDNVQACGRPPKRATRSLAIMDTWVIWWLTGGPRRRRPRHRCHQRQPHDADGPRIAGLG